MQKTYGEHYDFVPKSFLIPSEFSLLELEKDAKNKNALWIVKPVNLSRYSCIVQQKHFRGRGIFVEKSEELLQTLRSEQLRLGPEFQCIVSK